jgi:formiminoglutamase
MSGAPSWLAVERDDAPLIVSIPHAGTEFDGCEARFVSAPLARRDADWHIPQLYDFARALGATIVRTALSRSLIDVNRDPSGASLYPGHATTELCPTTTFDGEPLYRQGEAPDAEETAERRRLYFEPYHAALAAEIARLSAVHPRIALYDAHAIRSRIPRLFDGELPVFNLGTNAGTSCDPALRERVVALLAASGAPFIADGRFKGGWITRRYGRPKQGVHALQMELACRAYMEEPERVDESNWPTPLDESRAAATRATLKRVLEAALAWIRV